MYRDFQSRNVMVKNGEPWFIDFQGGRKGPIYYDVASFLWQAKAKYPAELRQELIADYLQALRGYMDIDEKHFFRQLRHFVHFRLYRSWEPTVSGDISKRNRILSKVSPSLSTTSGNF